MTVSEILRNLMQEKFNAMSEGTSHEFIRGLEAAMAVIRIMAREEGE